ncbi:MAG: helix-turn-helix transcriptional regulator [Clostridia bacterium]|nr:helix-turn-helix transcriptional regulator [Clostridia bacterium]
MFYKYLFTEKYTDSLTKPNIISFSYTELNNEPSLLHSHPHTEIIIPQNNNGLLSHGNEKTILEKSHLYIIPPNITHTEYNTSTYPQFRYFVLKLKNIIISNANEKNGLIDFIPTTKDFQELNHYLTLALNYLSEKADEDMVVLNLSCFYHKFLKLLKEKSYLIGNFDNATFPSPIQEVEYYISKNYNLNIQIDELANKYNIAHSTLVKKFKKHLGISPKDYLMKKRIEAAKHLLATSDFSVTQVAAMCGFTSPAYFTMYFKKVFKCTPKEYKEKTKSDKTT